MGGTPSSQKPISSNERRADLWKQYVQEEIRPFGGNFSYLPHEDEAIREAHSLLDVNRAANEERLAEVSRGGVAPETVLWVSIGSSSTQACAMYDGDKVKHFPDVMSTWPEKESTFYGTSHLVKSSSSAARCARALGDTIGSWAHVVEKHHIILHNSIGYLAPKGANTLINVTDPSAVGIDEAVLSLAKHINERNSGATVWLWPRSKAFRTQPENSWTATLDGLNFDVGGGQATAYVDGENINTEGNRHIVEALPEELALPNERHIKLKIKSNDLEAIATEKELRDKARLFAGGLITVHQKVSDTGTNAGFHVLQTGRLREHFELRNERGGAGTVPAAAASAPLTEAVSSQGSGSSPLNGCASS